MRPQYVTLSGLGVSSILRVNWNQIDFQLGLGVSVTGTNTSRVQFTIDDPADGSITPAWIDHATLQNITASAFASLTTRCMAVRLEITNYTNGSARLTVIQARPER